MNQEWLALLNNISLLNDIFINNIIVGLQYSLDHVTSTNTVFIGKDAHFATPELVSKR